MIRILTLIGLFAYPALGEKMAAHCKLMESTNNKGEVIMEQETKDGTIKVNVTFTDFAADKFFLGVFDSTECTAASLTKAKRKNATPLKLTAKPTVIAAWDALKAMNGGLFKENTGFQVIGNSVAIHEGATADVVGTMKACCKMAKMDKNGSRGLEKSTLLVAFTAICVQLITKML